MQFLWIVSIFSTLVSMGLVVVIVGQNPAFTMLNRGIEKQLMKLDRLNTQHVNQEFLKATVEKLVVLATKVVEDLEATAAKLGPELEKKKTENEACKAEKVKSFSFFYAVWRDQSGVFFLTSFQGLGRSNYPI